MSELWPGICAAAALVTLLVLVIRYHVHAFIALFVVSLALGLVAGLPPTQVIDAMQRGIADILREVLLLLALGAMLGRMLEVSGAAELIARRLIQSFGEKNTSLAVLVASFLIGIPIMFNAGFLLLIPIVWRLQRESKQSLLYFLLPLALSLGITHSLVPPHPGIVGAVNIIAGKKPANPTPGAVPGSDEPDIVGRVMVQTIIFGIALSLPLALLGWFGPGRWWARRQFVVAPENLAVSTATGEPPIARSFALALAIVLAPLVLSLIGFGAELLKDLNALPGWMMRSLVEADDLPRYLFWLKHKPLEWLLFLGKPAVALAVPTAIAFWNYGLRRGWTHARLAKLTNDSLLEVGGMTFLFGAAGGFKQVIQATGVGDYIAHQMMLLPLTPVAGAFCMAALVRIALGSATAAILTASALLADFAHTMPGQETLLVLAVACGVTIATQPADSGFWMLKEYGNLSVRDVMLRVNLCRGVMALSGLAVLLVVEAFGR